MTRINYILICLLLSGISSQPVVAQVTPEGVYASVLDDPIVQAEATRGLDLLYNMKYAAADSVFDLIDQRYPHHPIGPFLKALNTWWEILIDLSDKSHDRAFYNAMDEVLDRSNQLLKRDDEDFDAMFFKGAALGFRGRLRSNRGEWIKSARDGIRAMKYALGVARKDTSNHDFVFGKGIYDYYAVAVPERYPYVRPVMIFFPKGDRELGLAELERTARYGHYIQTEAAYFLVQIYYVFEGDYLKSIEYTNWLRDRHPDNSFFHTIEGRIHARWGNWRRAEEIFEDVLARYASKQTGYNDATGEQALYYLARSRMTYSDHDEALRLLLSLEDLTSRNDEDTYFKVIGRLRQGMCYDALGQRANAVARYRDVLKMKDWVGSHDRANRYLAQPYQ